MPNPQFMEVGFPPTSFFDILNPQGGAVVARPTHSREIAGSTPAPATKFSQLLRKRICCIM